MSSWSNDINIYLLSPVVNLTFFTQRFTFKAWSTLTPVVIHLIQARAIVLTRSGGTLIDVQVTVVALESRHTEALVGTDPIFADGSILAGLRLALVDVFLTVRPFVPGSTQALVPYVL